MHDAAAARRSASSSARARQRRDPVEETLVPVDPGEQPPQPQACPLGRVALSIRLRRKLVVAEEPGVGA